MSNKRLKILVIMLTLMALMSVLLAACARPGSPEANQGSGSSNSGGGGGGTSVHMGATNFLQNSVSLSKGSMLTLIDDVQVEHIIQNGTWANGNAKPGTETGAPTVNATFNGGDSHTVGPFTTAGTFQLYCTIHTGMNLTVTVK